MALSLAMKLKALSVTNFQFVDFDKKVTTNDQGEQVHYFLLHLAEPIESVTGTNSLYNPQTNTRIHLFAADVVQVSVGLEMIEKFESEFTFKVDDEKLDDELQQFTGEGSYKGNLLLDVARSGEVWLTDTKFSKMSGDYKKEKRNEELSALVQRIQAKTSK